MSIAEQLKAVAELGAQIRREVNGTDAEDEQAEALPVEVPRLRVLPDPVRTTRSGYRWGEKIEHRPKVKYIKPKARKGEVRMIDFKRSEAVRCGVSTSVIYERIMAGKYPGLKVRRAHSRCIYVMAPQVMPRLENEPFRGEVALKDWVAMEAVRRGVSVNAIYNNLSRGKYPGLEFRRVNQRVVFVKINAEQNK